MLDKLFWKFITVCLCALKLIVLALGLYYVALPSVVSVSIYLYDSINFLFALFGNYINNLEMFRNLVEILNKIQFNQQVCSFLYKQGYFHIWNTVSNDVYTSRMLWNVSVTFWYEWALPYFFDTNYAWRLDFIMVPFSKPSAFYILPYWQNYAHLYYQLGCAYNQFFDAGNGYYAFPSVNRFVSGMSGSYLLVEYRYAWILTLYNLIKPAMLFSGIPLLFDMLSDLYKYGIDVYFSFPMITQYRIFQFALIIGISYKLVLNNTYFNNYFLVRIFSGSIRDVAIKNFVILFVWFLILYGVICCLIFFLFKVWLVGTFLYLVSMLCVFVYLLCFLVRKVALNHYVSWVQKLDINNYVITKDTFVNHIIITGLNILFNKIKKGSIWFYKEWVRELARDRHNDKVINFWYEVVRYLERALKRRRSMNKMLSSNKLNRLSEPFYSPSNLYRYYLYVMALWVFLLTNIVVINKVGMFNLKFVENIDLQHIMLGERNQIFHSTRLPVTYSEEYVPVSLKVSRGGLWVRSTYREVSPLFFFRNKDLLRYWNLTDYDKTMLWDPNFTYIMFNLDKYYYTKGIYGKGWSKLYKRIGGLYSISFDTRAVVSLITFYEYYARLISIYTMPVFLHFGTINVLWKIRSHIIKFVRDIFNFLVCVVFKRFKGIFNSLFVVYYNYISERSMLRNNYRVLPYSKVSVIFNLAAYNRLNVNNHVVEIYQHDKKVTANKWTKIKRVFRLSELGISILGGLSIKLVGYIFVLISMKVAYVLFRTYERFIIDYLLYYVLSFLYKIWFFSKLFDMIDYNMNTPFIEKNLRKRYRKRHLTNPTFLRERLVCTRYYLYGKRSWHQTVRGKALFFHKQPNAFDWNLYL